MVCQVALGPPVQQCQAPDSQHPRHPAGHGHSHYGRAGGGAQRRGAQRRGAQRQRAQLERGSGISNYQGSVYVPK